MSKFLKNHDIAEILLNLVLNTNQSINLNIHLYKQSLKY
jgi:hypothetical protein